MKILKRFLFIYIGFFVFLLLIELWARYAKVNFSISFLFYWMYLIALILVILIWKLTSDFSLKLAFILTLCGMFFAIFNISNLAEVILRLGFVGWIVGIIQAAVEFRKNIEK